MGLQQHLIQAIKILMSKLKEYIPGGVEYAFETAGVVPAMKVAYQITKRGGQL